MSDVEQLTERGNDVTTRHETGQKGFHATATVPVLTKSAYYSRLGNHGCEPLYDLQSAIFPGQKERPDASLKNPIATGPTGYDPGEIKAKKCTTGISSSFCSNKFVGLIKTHRTHANLAIHGTADIPNCLVFFKFSAIITAPWAESILWYYVEPICVQR